MKKGALVTFALALLCLAQLAVAQIPRVISYQGVLRTDGRPFQGDASLIFKLSRGVQTAWTSGTMVVHVDNGVFGVLLGPFPQDFSFDGIDSLGITLDGTELSPRVALSASPFSINASHSLVADSAKNPGPQGPKGDKGFDGTPGSSGLQGAKGDDGLPGSSGLKGDKGDAGLTGSSGLQGAKGDDGLPGSSGLKGDKGDAGLTGSSGLQGAKGDAGLTGSSGLQGAKGDDGLPGSSGLKGDKGDAGLTGASGLQGAKGDDGLPGSSGLKGDKGDVGLTGSSGLQGAKGDAGLTGSSGLQGVKGDSGMQGPSGLKGDKGDTGFTGIPGSKGDKGDIGITGAKGDSGQGPKGDQGPQGLQGTPDSSPISSLNTADGILVYLNSFGRLERTGAANLFRLRLVSPKPYCHFTAFWHTGSGEAVSEGVLQDAALTFQEFDLGTASHFTILFGDADSGISFSKVDLFRSPATGKWFGFVATQ